MNLAKRIRDLRYSKGWGPDELANRAKISRTALTRSSEAIPASLRLEPCGGSPAHLECR